MGERADGDPSGAGHTFEAGSHARHLTDHVVGGERRALLTDDGDAGMDSDATVHFDPEASDEVTAICEMFVVRYTTILRLAEFIVFLNILNGDIHLVVRIKTAQGY